MNRSRELLDFPQSATSGPTLDPSRNFHEVHLSCLPAPLYSERASSSYTNEEIRVRLQYCEKVKAANRQLSQQRKRVSGRTQHLYDEFEKTLKELQLPSERLTKVQRETLNRLAYLCKVRRRSRVHHRMGVCANVKRRHR